MGTLLKMCYFKTSCILIISAIKHLCVQQRESEKKNHPACEQPLLFFSAIPLNDDLPQ